jgi:hypothetical protein
MLQQAGFPKSTFVQAWVIGLQLSAVQASPSWQSVGISQQ